MPGWGSPVRCPGSAMRLIGAFRLKQVGPRNRPEFSDQALLAHVHVNLEGEDQDFAVIFPADQMDGEPAWSDADVKKMLRQWILENIEIDVVHFEPFVEHG